MGDKISLTPSSLAVLIDPALLLQLERAAIHAWPARQIVTVDGWKLRSTGGASKRANSVATHEWTGHDLEASIARVEQIYAAAGEPARFQVSPVGQPAGLDQVLAARGYAVVEPCTTMTKLVAAQAIPPPAISQAAAPDEAWYAVYLAAISHDRRPYARGFVERVPAPRAFFSLKDGEQAISVGLGVLFEDVVVVQCMATRMDARGKRGGEQILAGIEAWAAAQGARNLVLDMVSENAPARALYARFGFRVAGEHHFRVRELGA